MQNTTAVNSIIQKIWSDPDVVIFIFAGCSAEFTLNQSIDWLYYTGKLPNDPIGRLFSTIKYAQEIIFKDKQEAFSALKSIQLIHKNLETKRGVSIPNEAYLEVLDMLIYYSIKSYEILNSKLNQKEKEEVLETFNFIGKSIGIINLKYNFKEWEDTRKLRIDKSLNINYLTYDLLKKYEIQLSPWRFHILKVLYVNLLPIGLLNKLQIRKKYWQNSFIFLFKLSKRIKLNKFLMPALFPKKYKLNIRELYNSI